MKITIKIIKSDDYRKEEEDTKGKKWLIVNLEEAVQYGTSSCSKIKIEFNSEEEIKGFEAGKNLNLEISEDKVSVENELLVVLHPWSVDRTVGQKVTDTATKAGEGIKETSKKVTQSAGKSVESTGKNMQDWPTWVVPTIIIVGIILLIGFIVWIFKRK